MEVISFFQIAGLIGFVGYLAGFAGLQLGYLDGNGNLYSMINIVSASLVLVGLTEQFNLPSALIQVSWIVIGLVGVTLRIAKNRRLVA